MSGGKFPELTPFCSPHATLYIRVKVNLKYRLLLIAQTYGQVEIVCKKRRHELRNNLWWAALMLQVIVSHIVSTLTKHQFERSKQVIIVRSLLLELQEIHEN